MPLEEYNHLTMRAMRVVHHPSRSPLLVFSGRIFDAQPVLFYSFCTAVKPFLPDAKSANESQQILPMLLLIRDEVEPEEPQSFPSRQMTGQQLLAPILITIRF